MTVNDPSAPGDPVFKPPGQRGWRAAGVKIKSAVIGAIAVVVVGGVFLFNSLSDFGLLGGKDEEGSAADKAACADQFEWVSRGASPEGLGASFRIMLNAEDPDLKRLSEEGQDKLVAAISSPSDGGSGTGLPPDIAALFDIYNNIGKRCQELSPEYRRQMDAYCRSSGTCSR